MAYLEHDDPAYAADVDGPATAPLASSSSSSSSPSAASARRPRTAPRPRTFGLAASSRLRQLSSPTKSKRDDPAASDVETPPSEQPLAPLAPLGFGEGPGAAAAPSSPNGSRSSSTRRRPLITSTPRAAAAHKNKFAFDDDDDDSDGSDGSNGSDDKDGEDDDRAAATAKTSRSFAPSEDQDSDVDSDALDADAAHDDKVSRARRRAVYSPISPISPLSLSTVFFADASTAPSTAAAASAPVSSVHTSIASAAASTAPTSPLSPSPSSRPNKPATASSRSPSSSPAPASRFPGLSSHPVVLGTPLPVRSIPRSAAADSSSVSSSLQTEKRREPFPPVAPLPDPPLSASSPGASSAAAAAMLVGNFSRPRQPSIKQSLRPVPTQPESPASAALPSVQPAWPRDVRERARGLSASSNQSSSAGPSSSSLAHRPSHDHLRPSRLAASSTPLAAATSPRLPRPPVAYSRVNGAAAADPQLATADEDSRSSYRSQWTAASTAPRTLSADPETPRSSYVTKSSSAASMSWFTNGVGADADEDLSVDDVMGMYENGFGDSTGAEDNDGPPSSTVTAPNSADEDAHTDGEGDDDAAHAGDRTPLGPRHDRRGSASIDTRIGSQILEAMSDPLPIPSRSSTPLGDAADSTRPPRPVRYSGLSSSVPEDSSFGLGLVKAHMDSTGSSSSSPIRSQLAVPKSADADDASKEKRDSAKMLESADDKSPSGSRSPRSPTGLPQTTTPALLDSRPGSSKAPSLFARAQTEPDDPSSRDRYGFRKHNQYITREQYDAWNGPYTDYIGRRRRKWVAYLRDSGLITDKPTRFPPPSVKTKRFVRKGIPPEWRGAAWFYYAGGPSIVAKHPGIYNQLLARARRGEAKDVDVEAIERDLHRTFPDNAAFQFSGHQQPGHGSEADGADASSQATSDVTANRPEEPPIVSKLRRVLLAFSIYNPRIGYCQSLNFLAGLLLLFVETEEHCFWLLNVITRIFLPGTHEMSLEGSKVDLGVLMAALQESLPGVWDKIGGELEDGHARGHGGPNSGRDTPKHGTAGRSKIKLPRVGGSRAADAQQQAAAAAAASVDRLPPITLCMTAWFMSCFIGTLPIETTLRVWDIFFYEGSKTLFRVALAIFKLGESEIRAVSDPMEMFGVVQAFPRRLLDCNMLMETTFRRRNGFGHLSQETIDEKRRERRDAFKEARDSAAAAAAASAAAAAAVSAPLTSTTARVSHEAPAASGSHDAAGVHRKGTLFGRRRERRPAEVM